MLSIALSAGIFATTIQTQDFKDIEGDRLIGRQTLPINLPWIARFTVLPILLAWSIGLSFVWRIGFEVSVPFVGLAALIGVRFIVKRDVASDKISFYYLYNVRGVLHESLSIIDNLF